MDRKERMFLGFRYARKTLPCITGEASCPYVETWFKQDLASAGKPETTARRHGGGNILAMQSFGYATNGTTIPRTSFLTSETTYSYDATGCPSSPCAQEKQTSVTHQYDAYGNRTQSMFAGEVGPSGDERSIVWVFKPNPTPFIVGLVAKEVHFDQAGAAVAGTRFTYDRQDQAPSWEQPPTKGHATHTEAWLKEENRWTVATARYDSWGNVISVKDATNRETVTTYENTYNIYPHTVQPVLTGVPPPPAEVETTVWDAVCGLPEHHTDANSQPTTFQSDALCRRTGTVSPLGGFEEIFYRDFGDPNLQRIVVETPPAVSGGSKQFTAQHFDGLRRPFYTVAKGPSPTQSILSVKTFNARGQVTSQTAPYYAGDPSYTTTYAYDALDRVTVVRHPDNNTVGKSYGLWSETTTDENGKPTTLRFDAYGRTIAKEQSLSGQTIPTTLAYDSLGRLVGMADALDNAWAWQFDSLGRNQQKTDPDAGTWSYVFDDAGRMLRQTDAKTQRIEFDYDPTGRRSAKRTYNPGGALTGTVSFIYSEARSSYFNRGRLTTMSGPGTTSLLIDHDARGRAVRHRRTLDGVEYLAAKTFDAGDRAVTVTYPDETIGPFTYDQAGRLKFVPGILTEVLYDAAGRATRQTHWNGTLTEKTYTPDRGFLTRIVTFGSAQIQDLTYAPDPAGIVTGVTSTYGPESWAYGYDDLYRLTSATNQSDPSLSQTWQHDEIGRITSNSRVGSYTYPSAGLARPHAPLTAGSNSYAYDTNGNQSVGAGRTLAWNVENLPTQINSTQFQYDGDSERLKKTTGASVSRYPFGDDYEITNGIVTKYISAAGLGVVAKRTGGQTYWLHADHPGSIQAITNQSGAEVQRRTYRAFGQKIADTTSHVESRGWIDQRPDDETGLTYLHARYYDSALGLFISPDPLHPARPGVGLNRYSYSFGSPVNGTDRGGLMTLCGYREMTTNAEAWGRVWNNGQATGTFSSNLTQVTRQLSCLDFDDGIFRGHFFARNGEFPDPRPRGPALPGQQPSTTPTSGTPTTDPGTGSTSQCLTAACGGNGGRNRNAAADQASVEAVLQFAAKVTNLSNTVLGLLFAGAGFVGPGGANRLAEAGFSTGNNAIQITNHPFIPDGRGLTIGNVILYGSSDGPFRIGLHERQHTYQGELYGPAYLPAHLAGGLYSLATSRNWHDNNWMERGPEGGCGQPAPWCP